MAIAIEQFTAPGKFYIDQSFEEINRRLKEPDCIHTEKENKTNYKTK